LARVPSAGDKQKDRDGNKTDEVLSVPNWEKGSLLHKNVEWAEKVQIAIQDDIEAVSQRLILKHSR